LTTEEALKVKILLKQRERLRKEKNDSRRQKSAAKDPSVNSQKFKNFTKNNRFYVFKDVMRVKNQRKSKK